MSTRTLKTTLRKLRALFGDRGFQQAGRDFLRTGNEPPTKWKDRCEDLAETIAAMKSLDLDYDKPGPEEDFEAVLALKREEWPRVLTPRWYPLFIHAIQHALWNCVARFVVIPSGRRSGKSERAMRFFVMRALSFHAHPDGRFFACAPTHDQARDLFWDDIKAFIPPRFITDISEGRLTIYLWNGAQIRIRGLDVPSRVEGKPVDGMIVDEFGDMRKGDKLWEKHLEAVLTEVGREGWAWIFGVPRGRPHYKKFYDNAKLDTPDWQDFDGFTWKSKDILSPAKLERIQRRTDPMTFASEWEASFETTGDRIYYQFSREAHLVHLDYDPRLPIDVSADFNTAPGVLIISQEQPYTGPRSDVANVVTAVIGEVWIQSMSNTPRVMEQFNKDWGQHKGRVRFFGDATGGAKKTTSVRGSDWDIIREMARKQFPDRCMFRVPRANPPEVSRTNAVNAHLMATDGTVSTLIDPDKAPHLVTDFEDVCPKEGTREIEKTQGSMLTHCSDGFGYRIYADFPIDGAQYGEDALW